ncbi:SOS-response transcriptional repressor LexA (RecA-mediated autopeptidase) [Onishia taeanensis]|uniref:SOS-response transcriptional repressor LexA (RecA-mediated autopeptidase) n=1 Tax=Onishia taeanensis TaxID=284577 RepID=A0A1G7NDL4_9GAMM|nr:S24 family peptidase [Halomonas taeanensis]SDF72124.1 SOS-response transcriptional repressor LexA (RecA-mediated autopeptidase) [Halomonas taeanensis]
MKDIEVFKARVKEAIRLAKENGCTQARIGEEAGVSPQAVGQWARSGKVSSANLAVLARLSGLSLDWFYQSPKVDEVAPSGPRVGDANRGDTVRGALNAQEAPQPIRYYRYPVISRVQAGAWTECVTPYEPGAEPQEEATDYRAQGRAFWLEVQGDSMTAPASSRPSIPEGTLVLFDTGIEAVPGKLVAAQLDDSNEATFKQLIEDGGRRYLRALNPAYPLIPINGNCRILGVAVEAKTRL